MSSDASAVDAAVVATLAADPTLSALMPDGVCIDVAKDGATRFVMVQFIASEDEDAFGPTAYERYMYLVKAVALTHSATDAAADVRGAALRIHELLQDVPLTIAGYTHMVTLRSERIRYTEVDSIDASRWQHRGGHYNVFVSPNE